MSRRASTLSKLGLLGALYLSQGLPFGFFTQALPVFLRQQGLSLGLVGLSSLLALPWALKFLWAPWVDRGAGGGVGRRRGWIVPLQLLTVALMAALAFVDPSAGVTPLIIGVLLINLLAATQDIATDGLAVDILTPEERGPGNGVQVAGYRVGMIIGGGVLLAVYEHLGWTLSFLTMAALLLAATLPIWRHREAPAPISLAKAPPSWLGVLSGFLRQPGVWAWVLLLVLYKGADAMASSMSRLLLVDLGLTLSEIGRVMGIGGFTAGLLGALAGGWGVRWLGRRRALLGFGIFQGLAVGGYMLPAAGLSAPALLYGLVILDTFAGGMATAALFTLMMDACRPETEGSDYTIQASVVVIATGGTSALSGFLAEAMGYLGFFAMTTAATLGGLLLAWSILRRSRFEFAALRGHAERL